MSNSYFQFKQFRIAQDKCAMKVSTDACIQGAWTPVLPGVNRVLDIGTGTGLLSLMLAQRCLQLQIDAVELDIHASVQAAENFAASSWRESIHITAADIGKYDSGKQYDLIVCNPPFFRNDLLGPSDARNNVRHGLTLSYEDLLLALDRLLMSAGYASILLPYTEFAIWEGLLNKNGWQVFNRLLIYPNEDKAPNRVVGLCCRKGDNEQKVEKLIIRTPDGYSDEFRSLLAPFYLYF